jgi:FMN reductase
MSDVVELIGNPRAGSRTRTLADAVTAAVLANLDKAGVTLEGVQVLELAEIVAVSFGPEPATVTRPVPDALDLVRTARVLVVASPTYKGSYTGLLKIFLDRYGHRELAGVVAIAVGVAAAEPHRQAIGAALAELLTELGATVPAPPLAVLESSLGDPHTLATGWADAHTAALAAALPPRSA